MTTRLISLRTHTVGGALQDPVVFDWDGAQGYLPVAPQAAARAATGQAVVLAVHGFNVNQRNGAGSLAALAQALALGPGWQVYPVLWPGDFWLPVVNYPWEADVAVQAGRRLAAFLNRWFTGAASISFVSHSLGARVVLEAVKALDRPAGQVCLTAAAADRPSLAGQYRAARDNAGRTAVLSSVKDLVLKLAYPAGDFLSDVLLGDDDSPWQGALGLDGPPPPVQPPVAGQAIPKDAGFDRRGYNHGDYLPPPVPPAPPPPGGPAPPEPKWTRAAAYMRRSLTGQPSAWS